MAATRYSDCDGAVCRTERWAAAAISQGYFITSYRQYEGDVIIPSDT